MFLKQLNLTNFRNYSQLNIDFDSRPTIFVGDNAQGKSNILESIYLLSTTKSFRAQFEEELVKNDEKFARVEGFIDELELMVILNKEAEVGFKKKLVLNGLPKRALDFIGNLPAVVFYPEDINMVTGSPSLRRWHLDLILAQIDARYKKVLTLYEQFLTSRNRILKRIREGEAKRDELEYWTKELVEKGNRVSEKRKAFFEFINNAEKILGDFIFEYLPSDISIEKLDNTIDREIASAQTLIGPHRDDFRVILSETKDIYSSATPQHDNGRDMSRFGSRGEQRMATLAFKMTSLEYMAKILGKRPLLLLDDVFSELDPSHRATVASIAKKQQTIIATVELENIPKEFLDSSRILRVEDGRISSFVISHTGVNDLIG